MAEHQPLAPPAPGSLSDLTWANASIDTPMGRVGSAWSVSAGVEGQVYRLHVTVPGNARGQVVVPVSPAMTVKESGVVVWAGGSPVSEGGMATVGGIVVAAAGDGGRSVVFDVGGGAYTFVAGE